MKASVRKPNAKKNVEDSRRRSGGSASKNTGRRYENEFCAELSKKGISAQRIPQSGAAGGRFGSDVMVWPNQITSFTAEVKYRSRPTGFTRFLKDWAALGYQPVKLKSTDLVLMRLDEFPERLSSKPKELACPVPAQLTKWMSQAQKSFGFLAIRFPQRVLEHRWLIALDASSRNLLRGVTFTPSATPSDAPADMPS